MIVIVGGMFRSGSTFSFNIARELLASRGGVAVAAVNSLEEAVAGHSGYENLVIKTHAPDLQVTGLIARKELPCICTYRNPEDAIASWMKIFGFNLDESVTAIKGWLKWHQQILPYVLNISYETIDRRPLRAILEIQTYLVGWPRFLEAVRLWRKYSKTRLKEKYDRLKEGDNTKDIGFSYYDDETFFHRRHISSVASNSADAELSSEQLAFIRTQLKEFVDPDGNYRIADKPLFISTSWLYRVLGISRHGTF
jgi:hypothetical protein